MDFIQLPPPTFFDLCFTKRPGLEVAWQRWRRRIPQRLGGGRSQSCCPNGVAKHAGYSQDGAASSAPICSYKTRFPAKVRETCVVTAGVITFGVSSPNMAGWRNSIVLILNSVTVPLLFGITMQPPDNDVCGN